MVATLLFFGYITVKIQIKLKIMSAKYNTKEYYQRLKKQVLTILFESRI